MAAFVLNISCTVCKAKFQKADSIYSTSCGHIFHFTCMNQWQCRSTSCPVCRSYNPQTFRIYLNFEDVNENNLEVKLKADEEKIKQMCETIGKKDEKINSIKRLYITSEQWRAELQDHIQKISHEYKAENERLSKMLSLKLEEIENLKPNLDSKEILEVNKKLEVVSLENLKLKENLAHYELLNVDLNQKIKIIELKLNLVTDELKKHIKENGDLTKLNSKEELPSTKAVRREAVALKGNKINEDLKDKSEERNDCMILITDFPKKELIATVTLKANIVLLASKMMLFLRESDIAQVRITKLRSGKLSDKINLTVNFKSIEKKEEFISNRNLLKLNKSTKTIIIKEFMDDEVYAVFKYANKTLRSKGFNFIYCKNNQIFVKKNHSDKVEVPIKNKSDVDKIVTEYAVLSELASICLDDHAH